VDPWRPFKQLRHGLRARLSFVWNWLRLIVIRQDLRRRESDRVFVGIMLLEHFGDIVACEPIVREIRAQTPNAFIVWGVRSAYRELIDSNPQIDATITLHCLSERVWLADTGVFDRVIDLHLPGRYCALCRTPAKMVRPESAITLANFYTFGGILSAFCQCAGFPALDQQPRVYIDAGVQQKVDALNLPDRYIVVHARSNAKAKDWPDARWKELLLRVRALQGAHVVEVGLDSVFGSIVEDSVFRNLCGRLTLRETAEVIRRARIFVGIDSGPAHFANALGTFGIVLLGSYLGFETYNPFSMPFQREINCDLLRSQGPVSDIPVENVYRSVERAWATIDEG
jgi:heptosyltransferase-3